MRIAVCSDTSLSEVNGVANTLIEIGRELRTLGHEVFFVTPDDFLNIKLPYEDLLVLPSYRKLSALMRGFQPDIVWVPTQGPLAVLARLWCWLNRVQYALSFHTRFPEYMELRYRIPKSFLYAYARLFFRSAKSILVPSQALADELQRHGLRNFQIWRWGVDLDRFVPRTRTWDQYERPIILCVGRVVEEKNIADFLNAQARGTKIVVGGGKSLEQFRSQFPDVVFLGEKSGDELTKCYSEADVFVFPSLLDTFGLVILEALASGVPVAALNAPHVEEIFGAYGVVSTDRDLSKAINRSLTVDRDLCRKVASLFSWRAAALQFLEIIEANSSGKSVHEALATRCADAN